MQRRAPRSVVVQLVAGLVEIVVVVVHAAPRVLLAEARLLEHGQARRVERPPLAQRLAPHRAHLAHLPSPALHVVAQQRGVARLQLPPLRLLPRPHLQHVAGGCGRRRLLMPFRHAALDGWRGRRYELTLALEERRRVEERVVRGVALVRVRVRDVRVQARVRSAQMPAEVVGAVVVHLHLGVRRANHRQRRQRGHKQQVGDRCHGGPVCVSSVRSAAIAAPTFQQRTMHVCLPNT